MENLMQKYPSSDRINTLYSYDTILCSDSVEWCPHFPNQNTLVCGNYQLAEEKTTGEGDKYRDKERLGCILLFTISPFGNLKLHQHLKTAAVLDLKWCHAMVKGSSILGVANAEKTIEIYKLNVDRYGVKKLVLITSCVLQNAELETLVLSLDWSTGKYASGAPEIICSDSKGDIHKLKLANNNLAVSDTWHAHEYEAWIAAYYYWNTSIFFTGGDDSVLLKFDSRMGKDPVVRNKSYKAGVTAIHSNAKKEYLIATGSYDSVLRLWDIRYMKKSRNKLKMPGTLWKLKWDPFECSHLIAACMLGGVHIVKANVEESQIVESYYSHKSLAYGVDWSYLNKDEVGKFNFEGNHIIGTCSFYDHLLCVSKLQCEIKS